MIYGTQGTMAAYVSLRKSLPHDPLTSFLPVHLVGESPNLFVAYEGAPYSSVPESTAPERLRAYPKVPTMAELRSEVC